MLPKELDEKVMEMARSMRLTGSVVNYNVLIVIGKGLVIANDRELLTEYRGLIKLGWRWCTPVFKRMNWFNRKSTTSKPPIAPRVIKEVGFTAFSKKFLTQSMQTISPRS